MILPTECARALRVRRFGSPITIEFTQGARGFHVPARRPRLRRTNAPVTSLSCDGIGRGPRTAPAVAAPRGGHEKPYRAVPSHGTRRALRVRRPAPPRGDAPAARDRWVRFSWSSSESTERVSRSARDFVARDWFGPPHGGAATIRAIPSLIHTHADPIPYTKSEEIARIRGTRAARERMVRGPIDRRERPARARLGSR